MRLGIRKEGIAIFEKAYRDMSKLTRKIITDKNGHKKTVYVKLGLPIKNNGDKSEKGDFVIKDNIPQAIKNLKSVLSNYEVDYHEEKSRISDSRYLYIHFPKNKNYKFRFSDHDIPIHEEDAEKRPQSGEKLEGFFDCQDIKYDEVKRAVLNLLKEHGIQKRGSKPKWISKIKLMREDYLNSREFIEGDKMSLIDVTHGFNLLGKLSPLQLKKYYKHNSIKDCFKTSDIEIPPFVARIIDKYEV